MHNGSKRQKLSDSLTTKLDEDLSTGKISNQLHQLFSTERVSQISDILNEALKIVKNQVKETVRESFVKIDSTTLFGDNGEVWDELYDPNQSMLSFINTIWYKMYPLLSEGSYGYEWVFRDKSSGKLLVDIGTKWTKANFRSVLEEMTIAKVFAPGTKLEIVRNWQRLSE